MVSKNTKSDITARQASDGVCLSSGQCYRYDPDEHGWPGRQACDGVCCLSSGHCYRYDPDEHVWTREASMWWCLLFIFRSLLPLWSWWACVDQGGKHVMVSVVYLQVIVTAMILMSMGDQGGKHVMVSVVYLQVIVTAMILMSMCGLGRQACFVDGHASLPQYWMDAYMCAVSKHSSQLSCHSSNRLKLQRTH